MWCLTFFLARESIQETSCWIIYTPLVMLAREIYDVHSHTRDSNYNQRTYQENFDHPLTHIARARYYAQSKLRGYD